MRRIVSIFAVVSLVGSAIWVRAAGQNVRSNDARPEQPFFSAPGGQVTIHSSVELVLIDVRVTEKSGKPIRGLKPEQFSLSEDGHPQKISSLDYYDIEDIEAGRVTNSSRIVVPMGTPVQDKTEAVREAVRDHRLIALFFDLTLENVFAYAAAQVNGSPNDLHASNGFVTGDGNPGQRDSLGRTGGCDARFPEEPMAARR